MNLVQVNQEKYNYDDTYYRRSQAFRKNFSN